MNKDLLSTLVLFLSLLTRPVFAAAGGGSSIGPSACSFANLVCQTAEAVVSDRTWVCIFNNSESDFALVSTPTTDLNIGSVQLQPAQPGVVGAPMIYAADGFELDYIVDAADHPGYLTVNSAHFSQLPMNCGDLK